MANGKRNTHGAADTAVKSSNDDTATCLDDYRFTLDPKIFRTAPNLAGINLVVSMRILVQVSCKRLEPESRAQLVPFRHHSNS